MSKKQNTYRHRINIHIKDKNLNEILQVFLKQKIPLLKRSVFECFLTQLIEDLWTEMGDDFASFVLCKAYEQVVCFPLKTKTTREIIASAKKNIQEEKPETATPLVTSNQQQEDLVSLSNEPKINEPDEDAIEEDVSINDLLL